MNSSIIDQHIIHLKWKIRKSGKAKNKFKKANELMQEMSITIHERQNLPIHKYKDEPITDLEVSSLTCLLCFKFCDHKRYHRNDISNSTNAILNVNSKFSYFKLTIAVMEKNCRKTYQ